MRVDLSCTGAAVPETLLNDAEVHAHFQQMRGVRVPERMNMSAFGDAGALEGALERWIGAPGFKPRVVAGSTHGFERCVFQSSRSNSRVRSGRGAYLSLPPLP